MFCGLEIVSFWRGWSTSRKVGFKVSAPAEQVCACGSSWNNCLPTGWLCLYVSQTDIERRQGECTGLCRLCSARYLLYVALRNQTQSVHSVIMNSFLFSRNFQLRARKRKYKRRRRKPKVDANENFKSCQLANLARPFSIDKCDLINAIRYTTRQPGMDDPINRPAEQQIELQADKTMHFPRRGLDVFLRYAMPSSPGYTFLNKITGKNFHTVK